MYEREAGGVLWARTWDPALYGTGNYRRLSLGHRNKTAARAYAMDQAAKLERGAAELLAGRISLARLFGLYLAHHSPRKTADEQGEDRRRVELWTRVLGADKDPHKIIRRELEAFVDARRSGAIDARGREQVPAKRRPVRARPVEADVNWLRWLCNWATEWQEESGRHLMRENPLRGFTPPTEKNPRRPVATQDRYEKVRAVADQVLMEIRWDGHRPERPSYLLEILDLVAGTGRRITPVCSLRAEDLRLPATPAAPHGSIRWPADTDKMGRESTVPISPIVRAALIRTLEERGIASGYLFPSPIDATRPVTKDLVRQWLRQAERLAKLEAQQGSAWHAYRRGWATARKHLPLPDLAAAGGWKGTEALQRCYLHADEATMLDVVMSGAQLREVRKA
ncbi:MAG: tyrosine-type recombinase/integrase [Gemmatimonadales bacterium]